MEESAGEAVLRARLLGGLSQVELARRAGITQSVVSAYESGRRQPSLPALRSLIEAAGFEVRLELDEIPEPLRRLTGPVGRRVRRHREAVKVIVEESGMTNVRVFGSVARGEDRPDSDVDLLVDLTADLGLFEIAGVSCRLEDLLKAPVDLILEPELKTPVRARVDRDLIPL